MLWDIWGNKFLKKIVRVAVALAALGVLGQSPARAGESEIALLSSYIGNWSGSGVLVGGKEPERFTCRMTIAKGKEAKINYSGRCHLINMNLSIAGTIAYDDTVRRYQAVMSSNAGFTGHAVGQRQGDRITFDLAQKQTDRGGNDVRIGSRILLADSGIRVDFEVEFNNSGEVMTASVPFSR